MSDKTVETQPQAEVNTGLEKETVQSQETKETKGDVQKSFSQDDVNKLIADRLAREKQKYQEDVKKLTDGFNDEKQSLLAKEQEYTQQLSEKDRQILGYQNGILPERLDEALAVAEIRAKKDEVSLEEALVKVASEYTSLVGAKNKGGVQVNTKHDVPSNPYITDALVKRYPHLANQNKK
jgi:hypothetical protein